MAKATSLIPLLNIVMEAKFGARIWEWFTDIAKDASQGYVYDATTGRLKNMDEEDEDDESSIESEANKKFVLKKKLETYFIHATRNPPIYACWVGQTAPFATAHYGDSLFETVMLKVGSTREGVSRANGDFFSRPCLQKWYSRSCVQWMAAVASSLLRLTIARVLVSHNSRRAGCCFIW
jgi:hypothetical protein